MSIFRSKLVVTTVSLVAVGCSALFLHDWNQRELDSLDACLRVYGLSDQLLINQVERSEKFTLLSNGATGRATFKSIGGMSSIERVLRQQSRLDVTRTIYAVQAAEGDFGVEIELADDGLQVRCTE